MKTDKPVITERIWNGSDVTLDVSMIVGFAKSVKEYHEVIFKTSRYDQQQERYEPVVMIHDREYHSLTRAWIDYHTEYNQEIPWAPGMPVPTSTNPGV